MKIKTEEKLGHCPVRGCVHHHSKILGDIFQPNHVISDMQAQKKFNGQRRKSMTKNQVFEEKKCWQKVEF